jgi:hypothetical protein
VFFGPDGSPPVRPGFDAIVGNPPWEMLRGDTGSASARAKRRSGANQVVRFVRQAGIYRACTEGHVNQYQLFVERSVTLLRPGGRLGLVLPWGLASDHGSAGLRRLLIERCAVDAIVGFENSDAIFPIHRGVRFLLLSATTGRSTDRVQCRFGERDPVVLDSIEQGTMKPADAERTITLTPSLIGRLSGPSLAFPYIKRPIELRLLERLVATIPALSDPRGFGARFGRELNKTDDRSCFSPAGDVAVVEGKHIDPFRVRLADCRHRVRSLADLPSREVAREVQRHRLAYRDVASATNRVTLIAAIIPPGAVTVHTLYCLKTMMPPADQQVLCALLNSFVANFLVRLWVTTHLGTTTVERLPVPRPIEGTCDWTRLGELAACLSAGPGDQPGALADTFAELQARALFLYGVDKDEPAVVLDSFPMVEPAIKEAVRAWVDRLAVQRRRV